MEDMKDIPKLAYTSPREGLAEKFHMSEDLLSALNPGRRFDRAGDTIVVVDTGAATKHPEKADRVEVDKNRQTVKLFDKSNALIGFYPATVGSEEKPSPSGTLKVTEIDRNPTYRYNPGLPLQGRPFPQAVHHQAGTEQSGRHGLDQPVRRRLRHPRHAFAGKGLQVGVARLRSSHELGRGTRRGTGVEGHAGRIRRRRPMTRRQCNRAPGPPESSPAIRKPIQTPVPMPNQKIANRAIKWVQREERRQFHLTG